MSSLCMSRVRWDSTVLTLRSRRQAISFVVSPSAMRCRTSRSREVWARREVSVAQIGRHHRARDLWTQIHPALEDVSNGLD